jgi:hypothetical protein
MPKDKPKNEDPIAKAFYLIIGIFIVFQHIPFAVERSFLHDQGWVPHFGSMLHESHHSLFQRN